MIVYFSIEFDAIWFFLYDQTILDMFLSFHAYILHTYTFLSLDFYY